MTPRTTWTGEPHMRPRDWQDTPIARPELPSLAGVADADARLYLRFYLRSKQDADQEIARARCGAT